MTRRVVPLAVVLAVVSGPLGQIAFGDDAPATSPAPATAPATQPRPDPKPLSDHVKRGLEWLAAQQHASGAWGQGEESAHMRQAAAASRPSPVVEKDAPPKQDPTANVADTAAAMLALHRSGSTAATGPYAANLRRGLSFICDQVEKSDSTSLFITDARNTRLQSKLGTYVDTFLAAHALAELRPTIDDPALKDRVEKALAATLRKIEQHQQKDGAWANEGWAPALAQGLASVCLNRAALSGASVNEDVRKRAETYARGNFNAVNGIVSGEGSAGVELYSRSANLQALNSSDLANAQLERRLQVQMAAPTTRPEERAQIVQQLKDISANRADLGAATQAVVARLADDRFVAGFGSNGGEEFLSHMNIGEALLARGGGEEFAKWDKSMTENMNRIQNDDGSWSGHHCITGKTFCTATALMVLMVDRAPLAPPPAAPATQPAVEPAAAKVTP